MPEPLVLPSDEMAALEKAIEAVYGPDWRDKIIVLPPGRKPAMSKSPPEFAGSIIITWPQPSRAGILHGMGVTLTDAETGQDIQTVTALRVVLHADAQDLVWAALEMFAGADGKPAYSHPLHIVDGEPARGTFPFLVTEMRVAEAGGA